VSVDLTLYTFLWSHLMTDWTDGPKHVCITLYSNVSVSNGTPSFLS